VVSFPVLIGFLITRFTYTPLLANSLLWWSRPSIRISAVSGAAVGLVFRHGRMEDDDIVVVRAGRERGARPRCAGEASLAATAAVVKIVAAWRAREVLRRTRVERAAVNLDMGRRDDPATGRGAVEGTPLGRAGRAGLHHNDPDVSAFGQVVLPGPGVERERSRRPAVRSGVHVDVPAPAAALLGRGLERVDGACRSGRATGGDAKGRLGGAGAAG